MLATKRFIAPHQSLVSLFDSLLKQEALAQCSDPQIISLKEFKLNCFEGLDLDCLLPELKEYQFRDCFPFIGMTCTFTLAMF